MPSLSGGDASKHILEIGENLRDAMQSAADVDRLLSSLERLRSELQASEQSAESYRSQWEATEATLTEVTNELENFKAGTGISEMEEQLVHFNQTANRSAREFTAFIRSVNMEEFASSNDRVSELFEHIYDGCMTSGQAIAQFKAEFAPLIEENWLKSGGAFDAQIITDFRAALDTLGDKITEVIGKLNDMQTNGVKAIGEVVAGDVSSNSGGIVSTLEQVDVATKNLSGDARESYEAIVQIVQSLSDFANASQGSIMGLSGTFKAISEIGGKTFSDQKVANIQAIVNALSSLVSVGERVAAANFSWLNDLKINKTSLNNLATYLPIIAGVNYDKLQRLRDLDFSNFQSLKIDKGSLASITDFVNAINALREALAVPTQATQTEIVNTDNLEAAADGAEKAKASTDDFVESLNRMSNISAKLENLDIGQIAGAMRAGGVNGSVADVISKEFEGLSGRIKDVKVNFDALAADGSRVGRVIVNAMTDAGQEIQKVITLTRDESGAISHEVFGSVKTKFNIAEEYENAIKAIKEYYALVQKMYGSGGMGRAYRENITEQNGYFVASGQAEGLEEYVSQLNSARAAMEFYKEGLNDLNLSEQQKADITQLLTDLQDRLNLAMGNAKYSDNIRQRKEETAELEKAKQSLQEMIDLREKYQNNGKARNSEAFANNEQNIADLQNFIDQAEKAGFNVDELRDKLAQLRSQTDENARSMASFGTSTNSIMSGISRYSTMMFSGYRIVMMAVREIKKMVSTSIELDSAMTQLQIVTKASDATMQQFGQTAARVAKETATSITDVLDSATTFSRLGYSLDESAILAKYTGMLQRVGDIAVDDATDAVTAIIKAYDIDAGHIEAVMDRLVEVGNNFPISVSQIAEGMNNAAAALAAAGNSFDQSVALLTAANTVVQNASKASTGLRTIAARLRNTKAELDELGEEPIAIPKYEELVQQLTEYNVSLLDAAGNYRSTYEILRDLAAVWDDITPNVQAAITTALAGTRQQAIFNSIIDQFKEASGAMDAMANSAGALEKAYGIYMGSTQAHIDKFKAAFEELSQTAIDNGFVSGIVDAGTALLKIFTALSKFVNILGGLKTVLLSIAGVVFTLKIEKIWSGLTAGINSITRIRRAITLLFTDFSQFKEKLKSAGMSMKNVYAAIASAVIIAITSIISAIKRAREQQELAIQSAYDTSMNSAKESDSVYSAYEEYLDAKHALDGNDESKRRLTESTLALAKALGVETSAISGTKDELEKLTKLEIEDAIRKAEDAVSEAQSKLFAAVEMHTVGGKDNQRVRTYALKAWEQLYNGGNLSTAADVGKFYDWFDSDDVEKRIEAIRETYEYMLQRRRELQEAAKQDASILTSDEYGSINESITHIEQNLADLDSAEKLLQENHERYNQIVQELANNADRTTNAIGQNVEAIEGYAEKAQLIKDSLSEAWDLEDFSNAREELVKLSKEIGGISPDKIIELAASSEVLSNTLQQDGMDARFLAHILQSEITGGPGFDLITEDALTLNAALNTLSDEYDHLSESRARYESASKTPEKDSEFRSMADAYKTLNEEFEKGAVNSNAFWAAAEYLFGEAQLEAWGFSDGLDQIYEATQKNAEIFQDADSAGTGFLTRLKEIADVDGNVIGEDGGIIASIKELADGSVDFNIDDFRLDELAEKMGVSRDAINACVKALSMFGRVDMTDMDQVLDAMKKIGLGADFNSQSVINAVDAYNMLRETLGLNAKEAYDVMTGLSDIGVTLVDVNGDTSQLTDAFIQLGIAEDNAGTMAVNTDGLVGLMQQIGLTKEQAEQLAEKIGGIDNLSFINAEGGAESLDDVLKKIDEADFSNVESEAGGLSHELDISKMTAQELVDKLNELTSKKYTINMDRSLLESAYRTALNLKNTIESTPSAPSGSGDSGGSGNSTKQTRARGTKNAIEGAALVGEEDPELLIRGDQATMVGLRGPEIVNLKAGDQVISAPETKRILKHNRIIHGVIPALRSGTIGSWRPNGSATAQSAQSATSYGGSSKASGGGSSSSSSKKEESAFEREYKRHQHLLKMEAETQRDYLNWLNDAYQKAYKNNEIELDDYWKYMEEVYSGMKDLFMDYLSDIEHEIDMISDDPSRVARVVELYTTAIKAIEKEIEAARKAGLKDTDDYIQQLQKKMKDAQKNLTDMQEDAKKEMEDTEQELVDMRIKMMQQEIDDKKDGLEKQLSDLKDFYQKQKDMLRDARDEEKYLDDQAEKRKKVADIERELSMLQRDNSAWAAKRRLELEEELADAQKDLRDFEKDHAIEVAEEEIDKISELREKDINAQIEELENITPHELYEWALYDIQHATNNLFNEMVDWNNVYGDGIEKNVIEKWQAASDAFSKYWMTVQAANGQPVAVIGTGWMREIQGPVRARANGKRYASGTSNAIPGLHMLDEFGTETIFQSKNGQKYKMFTGGEKVLNAKASDFLYKFAMSGGEFLSKLVNGASNGLNYLTGGGRQLAVEAVSMGDIIINGNTDQSTVSEIRRAQRDALENLLHEFERLRR